MSRRSRYYRYLRSAHWKALREEAFNRDGYCCTTCGSPNRLRGHHKRYRKDFTACTVNDIVTLCNACHEEHHREKAKLRKQQRKTRQRPNRMAWLIAEFSAS